MITPFIDFLREYIHNRLASEFKSETFVEPSFDFSNNQSKLAEFIRNNHLQTPEIISLLLTLVPNVSPAFLNTIITDYLPNGGEFVEFGGVKGKNHRGIIPTGETLLYILYANDISARVLGMEVLLQNSIVFNDNIVSIAKVPSGEPKMSGQLVMDIEYQELFISGRVLKPQMSADFPASLLNTNLIWKDLILNNKTLAAINEIEIWLAYNKTLMVDWQMKNKIKPGYRVLFYGAPGTGKTLTASLLGKKFNKDVYRIDLSMVVSKYIGETEKNLSNLFDKAINKDWILFFDEADSIFGKRTNVRDAHDKYANQEVSYLLQRIEAHPGLVILASNYKSNIDVAFTRRFQSIVEFEVPKQPERLRLWKNILPQGKLFKESFLEELSKKYTLTGSNIVNIVQFAGLQSIAEGESLISKKILLEGIKKEYLKEGKTLA